MGAVDPEEVEGAALSKQTGFSSLFSQKKGENEEKVFAKTAGKGYRGRRGVIHRVSIRLTQPLLPFLKSSLPLLPQFRLQSTR